MQKRHLVVLRDPQDGEYGTKMALTEGMISFVAFPGLEVAIAQIIAA